MRRGIITLALLAAAAGGAAQAPPAGRAFTPAGWYRLTTVSTPALSPDGRLVAFTVTTVQEAENRRHSEVWVVPVAGGQPARYTSPATEASNPRFAPDGRYLFFTSTRAGGRGSTWALRMDAPAGEAVQVEDYPTGSIARVGGRTFAVFAQSVGGDSADARPDSAAGAGGGDPFARMPALARPPYGAITRPLDPRRFDGRHIVDAGYKANGRGFVPNARAARRWRPQQLFRQEFGDTAKQQLTDVSYSHRDVAVSPDGQWIAFVADARLRSDSAVQAERDSLASLPYDSARDEAPRTAAAIFIMQAAGGEPRRLAELTGSERG
ncbi:MAG: hypothetical protein FIB01_06980, partial [Gemmatimonadetes bacterium]|nr:hypothetical protein [Gemmatimonadota bacterium]